MVMMPKRLEHLASRAARPDIKLKRVKGVRGTNRREFRKDGEEKRRRKLVFDKL